MLDEAQDSGAIYGGLSDASAVPDLDDNSGWEPGIVIDYPVEPSPEAGGDAPGDDAEVENYTPEPEQRTEPEQSAEPEQSGQPAQAEQPEAEPPAPAPAAEPVEEPVSAEGTVRSAEPATAAEPAPAPDESAEPADEEEAKPAVRPPGKRKRAAVPSWDEIMFGGPPRSR
jgi:hypothetical protein